MKKLSEYEGEEALDLLADIIEPAAIIFSDKKLVDIIQSDDSKNKIKAVKYAIKNHKSEIMDILAILEGVPKNELKVNVVTLPMMVIQVMNDEDLVSFFQSQVQMMQ